jgi:hypothetical protein
MRITQVGRDEDARPRNSFAPVSANEIAIAENYGHSGVRCGGLCLRQRVDKMHRPPVTGAYVGQQTAIVVIHQEPITITCAVDVPPFALSEPVAARDPVRATLDAFEKSDWIARHI